MSSGYGALPAPAPRFRYRIAGGTEPSRAYRAAPRIAPHITMASSRAELRDIRHDRLDGTRPVDPLNGTAQGAEPSLMPRPAAPFARSTVVVRHQREKLLSLCVPQPPCSEYIFTE